VTREQLQGFKKILEAEQAGTRRTLLQNRRNIGIEKSADEWEEISYTADRELAMANLSRYSAFAPQHPGCAGPHRRRSLRGVSALRNDDRTETSEGGTLDSFVHPMPGSSRPQ
jgi:hypothetical protein